MAINFPPYRTYDNTVERIEEFLQLSRLAYGISLQLLFSREDHALDAQPIEDLDVDRTLYSMGDLETEIEWGWLTVAEYAEREDQPSEEVRRRAEQGNLGPTTTHPESDELMVIWPPDKQATPEEDLPEPGNRQYKVWPRKTVREIEFDLADEASFEGVQQTFLSLARSLGEPEAVTERASNMLYRSCFLLQWIAFEAFLRDTVHELYRLHPKTVMATDWAESQEIAFSEVFELSDEFSEMSALVDNIIASAVEDAEAGDQSVHGLINFLKKTFRFEQDPYRSSFVLGDAKYETTYQGLMAIKEVRNALVHDAGRPGSDFFKRYPFVPSKDGMIFFDAEFYNIAVFTLQSISGKLARQIENEQYRTVSGNEEE